MDLTPDLLIQAHSSTKKELLNVDQIRQAAELINSAQRPYILAGQGVQLACAESEISRLAQRADIPIACTLLGRSTHTSEHSLYAGMLGMHGNYAANLMTNQADVILAVGMRFDDRVTGNLATYAKQAKIIHIDIDSRELGKNVPTTIAIQADAREALEKLNDFIKPAQHPAWLSLLRDYWNQESLSVIQNEITSSGGPIQMAEAIDQLNQQTRGSALLVTDVGQHQMVVARYYPFNKANSLITSGGLGTMGFALPAAIGAKLGAPDRLVIAIIGDGGFQMTLQELGVLTEENLAVKIIILNNGYLGVVRQWQELFFDRRYAYTKMANPNFVNLAQSYDIPGEKIDQREDLALAIDKMLRTPGPYLLEIQVKKQANVFPMIPAGAGIDEIRLF